MGDKLWLYLSMAAGTIALVWAVVLCIRAPKQDECVFKYEETKTIFGMTFLSIALGYGVEIYKLIDPAVGGEGTGSYGMIAVLGLIAILMAVYTILYALNQKIYVYEDGLIVVDALAKAKTVFWEDIISVDKPGMQQAARFTCRGDFTFKVSGANKNYKRFMNYLEPKLKEVKGKNLISQIERNLM